jgi:hypothetical protein
MKEKRETKKPMLVLVRPTIKKKAKDKAESLNDSLSNVVDTLLDKYANNKK